MVGEEEVGEAVGGGIGMCGSLRRRPVMGEGGEHEGVPTGEDFVVAGGTGAAGAVLAELEEESWDI